MDNIEVTIDPKMEQLELIISGIKCDNEFCDFSDCSVAFADYPKYVNKPCDKCGQILLTEQDYSDCLRMYATVNFVNKVDAFARKINPFYYIGKLIKKFKK